MLPRLRREWLCPLPLGRSYAKQTIYENYPARQQVLISPSFGPGIKKAAGWKPAAFFQADYCGQLFSHGHSPAVNGNNTRKNVDDDIQETRLSLDSVIRRPGGCGIGIHIVQRDQAKQDIPLPFCFLIRTASPRSNLVDMSRASDHK
jgi:hypothetical protein